MSGRWFLDTNILLYLLSGDSRKADRAEALIATGGIISVQVLNEFAAVATRKLGMSWPEVDDVLEAVQTVCAVEPLTLETHERGKALARRYGLSVYDAMIIAAARIAGTDTLYSEDMQHGLRIEDALVVRNPFAD